MKSSGREKGMPTFGDRGRKGSNKRNKAGGTSEEDGKLGGNCVLEEKRRFYLQRPSNYHRV